MQDEFEIKNKTLLNYNGNAANVAIPDSVTEIERGAFMNCFELRSVAIPDSVTKIGHWAFASCENLQSIEIPKSIVKIGKYAFRRCNFDKEFFFELKGLRFENSLCIKNKTVLYCTNKKATEIEIPNGVEKIAYEAFFCYTGLKSVTIPASVKKIGNFAFLLCRNLQEIKIQNNAVKTGRGAFKNCNFDENYVFELGDLRFENSLCIKNKTVLYCTNKNARKIMIPNGIEKISPFAFFLCCNLQFVLLPKSIARIGKMAFHSCHNLLLAATAEAVMELPESPDEFTPSAIIPKGCRICKDTFGNNIKIIRQRG